ncbi:hypothetical protein DMC01_06015 [Campylobacter troglodytis]|nr:hypothetical protein DMC01_06015 [Campylobacter troglodytis]
MVSAKFRNRPLFCIVVNLKAFQFGLSLIKSNL